MSAPTSSDPEKGFDATPEKNGVENEDDAAFANSSDESHDGNTNHATDNTEAEKAAAPPAKNMMMDPSSFPDGGRQAWMTVVGGFCALFVSFGMPI